MAPLPFIRAALLTLLVLVAFPSVAGADPWWWQHDEDTASWNGAGGGWNGGSWRDEHRDEHTSWRPEQVREVQVRNLRVDRPAISPNGDGRGDDATIEFRLRRGSATVRVRVLDSGGATIRTLGSVTARERYGRFSWNGTNTAGATVADGQYRIVLDQLEEASAARSGGGDGDPLSVGIEVDTTAPGITVRRPTLAQLRNLSRRAGKLREARRDWEARLRNRGSRGSRWGRHRGHGHGNGNRWEDADESEREDWMRAWESSQLRMPVRFRTREDGDVTITARVAKRVNTMSTWRQQGLHELDLVLPQYVGGARARVTFSTADDSGNVRRHTVVVQLPAMPKLKPKPRTTSGGGTSGGGGGSTPPANIPTSGGGPFPDWLDPIMLRATYAAGVPQSWARSRALSNLVFRESSYRPTAQNPTSTAYGLFQFLDQTWAGVGCRKTSDAYMQSVCGLRYVQRRYRTPERAWAFWQANHWY